MGVHSGNMKCLQVNATPKVQRKSFKDLNMLYKKSNSLPGCLESAKYDLREEDKAGIVGIWTAGCEQGLTRVQR